jgi:membrane protease YdiL (CAAX protease family)
VSETASPEPPAPTRHETQSPEPPVPTEHLLAHRIVAVLEVLLCSDFVTQIAIGGTLTALGVRSHVGTRLNVAYVVALSLGDALLLILLIVVLLLAHGERPRDVLFGRRRVAPELVLGLPLAFMALLLAGAVIATIRSVAPTLHTVPQNPLQDLLRSPRDAWLFALVVLVAGGLREEIQRAFLLHRFEVWLGGPLVGLTVTSVGFGAGHLLQGIDASITTGLLGAFWGYVYLRRRSAAAPIVSHSGFDLVQVLPFLVGRG